MSEVFDIDFPCKVLPPVITQDYLDANLRNLRDNFAHWHKHLVGNLDKIKLGDKRLKVLYFGNIRNDLDLNIISRFSEISELSLYGIFNVEDSFYRNKLLPFYKGRVEEILLPSIICNCDIVLLPYASSSFSSSIIPAKIWQSLISCKPVLYSGINLNHLLNDYCNLLPMPDSLDIDSLSDLISSYANTALNYEIVSQSYKPLDIALIYDYLNLP